MTTEAMVGTTLDGKREELLREIELNRRLPEPTKRRAVREAAGVSLRAIAEFCGCTRQAVSAWELGTRQPKGQHLLDYLAALDLMRGTA